MIKRIALAAALSLSATPALAASLLYGSDNQNIYTVDTATGLATLVGANGLPGLDPNGVGTIVRDLTSSATTLYGAQFTFTGTGTTGAVVTIDPMTGAITATANLTGLLETNNAKGLYSIAFDKSTNTLFGNTGTRLYTINPTTGASTFVGLLPAGRVVGLGVNETTNALYAVNQYTDVSNVTVITLLELSKVNASILSTVTLTNSCACDIAFDPLTNTGYVSSAFFDPQDNFLYAGLDALNGSLTSASFIGQSGPAAPGGFNGLAFFGTVAVPEPTSWAMMMTGFGLAGFAMRRSKRLQARASSVA
jgi:hypothetical protein